MFKCKVCLEKDKRIIDLKAQNHELMSMVKKLTLPAQFATSNIEANAIMDGTQDQLMVVEDNSESEAERLEIAREAHAMLTASY